MKRSTRKAWRRTLRALREECPPLLPVRVRLVDEVRDYFGLTTLSADGTHFNLTVFRHIIEKDALEPRPLTRSELLDTLVHEWAHTLSWTSGHASLDEHDAEWGVAFARCYQATSDD